MTQVRIVLFLSVALSASAGFCADRIKVSELVPQGSLQETLSDAVKAFDSEDVDAYEKCFRESKRKSVRRRAAMTFAEGVCSMELVECHVIEMGEDTALAAVRYKMGGSNESHDILSTVKFVMEDGRWLIDGESSVKKIGRSSGARFASSSSSEGSEWDPMSPEKRMVSPNLHHLMGDIGIRPGMGCADGKCAGGRCQVR